MPVVGWAFGADAHRVVGYVADAQLCADARVRVGDILDGEDLVEAGLWADRIRGDRKWDYAKPWHYINIPDGVEIEDAERREDGDVLWAINEMNARLRDPELSAEEQAVALRFLIHFVADIHQPLHVGRLDDRGGNNVKATYFLDMGVKPGQGNLHAYWDSLALKTWVDDPAAYGQELLDRWSPRTDIWKPGGPEDWARESIRLRPMVYEFAPALGDASVYLGSAYLSMTRRTVRKQLVLAGFRLADQLNRHFCPAADPQSPSFQGP